jgi:ABC-type sugar transport system ATPase subunit
MSVIANVTLADLNRLSPRGWRQVRTRAASDRRTRQALNLRAASLDMESMNYPRESTRKSCSANGFKPITQLLLLDEPTRAWMWAPNTNLSTHE